MQRIRRFAYALYRDACLLRHAGRAAQDKPIELKLSHWLPLAHVNHQHYPGAMGRDGRETQQWPAEDHDLPRQRARQAERPLGHGARTASSTSPGARTTTRRPVPAHRGVRPAVPDQDREGREPRAVGVLRQAFAEGARAREGALAAGAAAVPSASDQKGRAHAGRIRRFAHARRRRTGVGSGQGARRRSGRAVGAGGIQRARTRHRRRHHPAA